MGLKLNRMVSSKLLIALIYRFTRLYSATLRMKIENEKAWLDHLEQGGSVLLCAWHQQFFSAIRHFQVYRKYKPGIMISQSKDGAIVAGVAQRTGWQPVRGSSSKGGRTAMKQMIIGLKAAKLSGHILDGPRGPAGVVKAGIVRMAHATDAAIVPFYVSADRYWMFNSWDKFILPKPFSKVTLRFDSMIHLERTRDKTVFEEQRQMLENRMQAGLIEPVTLY